MPRYSEESETALRRGKAAEHLVCADLLMQGHEAFLAAQGLPYDVLVDVEGRICRVQVKSTNRPRSALQRVETHSPRYQFCVRRAGKRGNRVISVGEFEVLALVALDIKCVAYMLVEERVLQTINLRPPGVNFASNQKKNTNKRMDEYPFSRVVGKMLYA